MSLDEWWHCLPSDKPLVRANRLREREYQLLDVQIGPWISCHHGISGRVWGGVCRFASSLRSTLPTVDRGALSRDLLWRMVKRRARVKYRQGTSETTEGIYTIGEMVNACGANVNNKWV